MAGGGAADGGVARGAVEDEGARARGAAVVVERGEERVGVADGGGDAGVARSSASRSANYSKSPTIIRLSLFFKNCRKDCTVST